MNLKKIISLVLCLLLLTSGCGKKNKDNIVKKMNEEITSLKNYNLKGNMEIYTDEETFTYSIEVDYLKDNFYKVNMVNQTNNHEQIILRNNDAVYVITPSLNKSFKFQSEWPYNNSQSYLLQTLVQDMENDDTKTVEVIDNYTIVKTLVNYSNNKNLINQKIYFDKDDNLKKVEVMDKNENVKIKMSFDDIDFKANYDDDYFKLDANMDKASYTEETSTEIEDIIYPMYMPENTYLTSEDVIALDDGERVILTFSGDSPFMIVQETVSTDDSSTLPVYGEIEWTGDTLGILTENTVNWIRNGVEYYAVSEVLDSSELLEIVNSISVMPVGK